MLLYNSKLFHVFGLVVSDVLVTKEDVSIHGVLLCCCLGLSRLM